ncbi:MAG: hypothetical protein IPM93_19955 [Candidatus Obscuribacter sp.]|nr:hypothetical protein [Candidatus Obscuribacter sp.]
MRWLLWSRRQDAFNGLSRDCALSAEVRLADSVEEMNLGFTTESQMTGGVSLMFKGMVQEWLAKARSAHRLNR